MAAKKVEITKKQATAFLSGKALDGTRVPAAKGKARRDERRSDVELEGKLSAKVTEAPRKAQEATADSKVRADALRGVVGETMARVYEELWPSMMVRERNGEVEIQIAEEAYIVVNMMVVGHPSITPRKPLKIREAEISNAARFCKEHK